MINSKVKILPFYQTMNTAKPECYPGDIFVDLLISSVGLQSHNNKTVERLIKSTLVNEKLLA
jgi:hypothetical protein